MKPARRVPITVNASKPVKPATTPSYKKVKKK
jgi:hypothetical protein